MGTAVPVYLSHPTLVAPTDSEFYYIPIDHYSRSGLLPRIGQIPLRSTYCIRMHIIWVVILLVDFCGSYVWFRLCMYSRSSTSQNAPLDPFIESISIRRWSKSHSSNIEHLTHMHRRRWMSEWLSSSQMWCILFRW